MKIEPNTIFIDAPNFGVEGTHRLALYEWKSVRATKGTVFCVHGLTRNGRDFDTLAEHLSENYHVFSLDVAGRGRSEWLEDYKLYSYPAYVADIAYIVAKLALSNIHFVGTSMGGIIGMMVANSFPKMLKTLTLNDIGCLIPAGGLKRIASYVGNNTSFSTRELAQAELRRRCAPYGIESEQDWQHLFLHSIQKNGDGSFRLAYDPAISKNFSASEAEIQDINLWALWEAVKQIPTLLIRGMESDLLTHATAIEMQNSHSNLKLLEIQNVGHAPALLSEEQIGAIREMIR